MEPVAIPKSFDIQFIHLAHAIQFPIAVSREEPSVLKTG